MVVVIVGADAGSKKEEVEAEPEVDFLTPPPPQEASIVSEPPAAPPTFPTAPSTAPSSHPTASSNHSDATEERVVVTLRKRCGLGA